MGLRRYRDSPPQARRHRGVPRWASALAYASLKYVGTYRTKHHVQKYTAAAAEAAAAANVSCMQMAVKPWNSFAIYIYIYISEQKVTAIFTTQKCITVAKYLRKKSPRFTTNKGIQNIRTHSFTHAAARSRLHFAVSSYSHLLASACHISVYRCHRNLVQETTAPAAGVCSSEPRFWIRPGCSIPYR